jgi:gas vesicle protein
MELDRENKIALLVGAAFGAALMFAFDPARGARRRALVRDKAAKALRRSGRAIHDRGEDIGNRLSGTVAEIRAKRAPPPTDHQLEERVRAELGHKVEHPKSIDVIVDDGFVTLSGDVLRDELEDVLGAVRDVPGVRKVHSEMQLRSDQRDIPSLQS